MPKRRSPAQKKPAPYRAGRAPVSVADMECTVTETNFRKSKNIKTHQRVSIHVHSIRSRLVDSDGVSAKAAIDGLVVSGILADDSAKYVAETTYSQSVGSPERTIIDLYEYEED